MLTHDEIKAELIRQIDAGKVRQVDVARKLNIAPARINEVRRGVRRIQQVEMPVVAEMLGLAEGERPLGRPVVGSSEIPNYGKVAQGVWLEESLVEPDIADHEHVPYDRVAGDPPPTDLFAVTPEGSSMNLAFPAKTRLICRRIPFGIGRLREGDYVIVERSAHDLYEMTCKRVEIDDKGDFWLHSESSDPKFAEPWFIGKPDNGHVGDVEIAVIAKVIRAVQVFDDD